jgi:hypothetical protein
MFTFGKVAELVKVSFSRVILPLEVLYLDILCPELIELTCIQLLFGLSLELTFLRLERTVRMFHDSVTDKIENTLIFSRNAEKTLLKLSKGKSN